jgi:hypothetical protein
MLKGIFQGVSLTTHIENKLGLHVMLSCSDCGACENSKKELGIGKALNNCEIAKQFHESTEELESKYNISLHVNTNEKCSVRSPNLYPSVNINILIPYIGIERDHTRISNIHFGLGKEWAAIIHKAKLNKSL